MKEVPMKLVTVFAEFALPKCMVPVKYVTKFTATPIVVNLSLASTPEINQQQQKETDNLCQYQDCTFFFPY